MVLIIRRVLRVLNVSLAKITWNSAIAKKVAKQDAVLTLEGCILIHAVLIRNFVKK